MFLFVGGTWIWTHNELKHIYIYIYMYIYIFSLYIYIYIYINICENRNVSRRIEYHLNWKTYTYNENRTVNTQNTNAWTKPAPASTQTRMNKILHERWFIYWGGESNLGPNKTYWIRLLLRVFYETLGCVRSSPTLLPHYPSPPSLIRWFR